MAGDVIRFENLLRMGLFWTLAVMYSYAQLLFQSVLRSGLTFSRSSPLTSASRDKRRLVCIVTGASSGIGKATAEALAVHGYHTILAGRSKSRLSEVIEMLRGKHENVSLEAIELDLSSVSSILSFTEAVKKSLDSFPGSGRLQLLVNNAGILAGSQRYNDAGFDSVIATNYLGPYFLTQQLLPILHEGSPQARIVNVGSFTHRCVRAGLVDEKHLAQGSMANFPLGKDWYSVAQVYENSKLCMLLFTYELHRRLYANPGSSQISVMAADPGIVRTNIMRELPSSLVSLTFFILSVLGLLQDPYDGSRAVVDAALAPEGLSGKYFFGGNGKTIKSSALSHNKNLAEQLWAISSYLCEKAIANKDQ
ncbi:hypothetical protein R1flu_006042 [Riccia fluitans]|uniref:Uncharacterized protein n=1 Tax=Riccia fluitans TaxID=41844 RepID=A0ABD1YUY0_9MARC